MGCGASLDETSSPTPASNDKQQQQGRVPPKLNEQSLSQQQPASEASRISPTTASSKRTESPGVLNSPFNVVPDGMSNVSNTSFTRATATTNSFAHLRKMGSGIAGPRRAASTVQNVSLGKHPTLLGRGTFGSVYKGIDTDTNRTVAVKEIPLPPDADPTQLDKARKEIRMMMKLSSHENICECLGESYDHEAATLRIYMEYVSGGSVGSLLREHGAMSEKRAARIVLKTLTGLLFLHEQRIAHRDLKGDNLLITENGEVKLADFGAAQEVANSVERRTVAGTAVFMAPEIVKGAGHGIETDIWSLGCCAVEMIYGKPPLAEKFSNQMTAMLHLAGLTADDKVQLPEKFKPSPECLDFVEKCLMVDPKARATTRQLIHHPWMVAMCGEEAIEMAVESVRAANEFQREESNAAQQQPSSASGVNPQQVQLLQHKVEESPWPSRIDGAPMLQSSDVPAVPANNRNNNNNNNNSNSGGGEKVVVAASSSPHVVSSASSAPPQAEMIDINDNTGHGGGGGGGGGGTTTATTRSMASTIPADGSTVVDSPLLRQRGARNTSFLVDDSIPSHQSVVSETRSQGPSTFSTYQSVDDRNLSMHSTRTTTSAAVTATTTATAGSSAE